MQFTLDYSNILTSDVRASCVHILTCGGERNYKDYVLLLLFWFNYLHSFSLTVQLLNFFSLVSHLEIRSFLCIFLWASINFSSYCGCVIRIWNLYVENDSEKNTFIYNNNFIYRHGGWSCKNEKTKIANVTWMSPRRQSFN